MFLQTYRQGFPPKIIYISINIINLHAGKKYKIFKFDVDFGTKGIRTFYSDFGHWSLIFSYFIIWPWKFLRPGNNYNLILYLSKSIQITREVGWYIKVNFYDIVTPFLSPWLEECLASTIYFTPNDSRTAETITILYIYQTYSWGTIAIICTLANW